MDTVVAKQVRSEGGFRSDIWEAHTAIDEEFLLKRCVMNSGIVLAHPVKILLSVR